MAKISEKVYQEIDEDYQAGKEKWREIDKLDEDILNLISPIPHKSILEIGCAKGNLTKKLTTISEHVVAIDVSEFALNKAAQIAPNAKFKMTSFEKFVSEQKFDVIVGSEVLYYMKNRTAVINKLQKYGKYLISNNFIFGPHSIGFGSILYEILLRRFKPLKIKARFSLLPLDFGLITLWKLD